MASLQLPGRGTLVTAALLVLGLTFAGYWIYTAVGDQRRPLVPWFAVAAVLIVALGLFVNTRRGGADGGREP